MASAPPPRRQRLTPGGVSPAQRGEILARAGEDKDEFVTADLDFAVIDDVKKLWQFYRDRRPDTYGDLLRLA